MLIDIGMTLESVVINPTQKYIVDPLEVAM